MVHNTFYAIWVLTKGGTENVEEVRKRCEKTPEFLASRQNLDGSWNNFPLPGVPYTCGAFPRTKNWKITPTLGHVHLTYCALAAYKLLGVEPPNKEKTIAWLRDCQGPGGGFTRRPGAGTEDIWETRAGVSALKLLGAEPKEPAKCVEFLNSLQNSDGGFGDRPGWRSRLGSTWYAVETLGALTGDARRAITPKEAAVPPPVETPKADGMKIYAAFLGFARKDSTELIDVAHEIGIDVVGRWALSYEGPEKSKAAPLQKYADDKGYGMTVIDEVWNYRIAIYYEGTGQGQHSVNSIIWPPGVEFPRKYMNSITHGIVTWDELRDRMKPLKEKGGLSFWTERLDSEAMERIGFDAAVEGLGGYDIMGIDAGRDPIRLKPWRERYVGRIPLVHHGVSMLQGKPNPSSYYSRTLFIAGSPSYADFVEAVKANRVVAVHGRERSAYYGRPEWVKYVQEHEKEWRSRWPEPPPGSQRFAPRR